MQMGGQLHPAWQHWHLHPASQSPKRCSLRGSQCQIPSLPAAAHLERHIDPDMPLRWALDECHILDCICVSRHVHLPPLRWHPGRHAVRGRAERQCHAACTRQQARPRCQLPRCQLPAAAAQQQQHVPAQAACCAMRALTSARSVWLLPSSPSICRLKTEQPQAVRPSLPTSLPRPLASNASSCCSPPGPENTMPGIFPACTQGAHQ